MQATFELSGEILERLRQESARSGHPQSALVEAALQTALPAPAPATPPAGDAAEANAAPAGDAPDATAQPRPPLNLPSRDMGQPLADGSNRDESYRILDDKKYWKFATSAEPASEESAPEASAPPTPPAAAAHPRPPLNLPSWSCGKPFVDVNNRDELDRALHDDEKFKELYGFYLYPDQEE